MNRAETSEEDITEIEDEVDTSQLLHGLHQDTEESSAKVTSAVREGACKAVRPAADVAGLRNNRLLVFVIRDNFSQLILDVF